MSVRVNLLPREVEQRNIERRRRAGMAIGAIVFIALLAALYVWQVGQVNDAKDRLAIEEQERDRLQGEVNRLNEFAQLESRVQEIDTQVATTLSGEVSFARILQDIATVMPTDATLGNLALSTSGQIPQEPAGRFVVGTVTASGMSLGGHAPGLERLLIAFEKAGSFSNLFFGSSTVDDEGVSTFSITFDLGPEVLTGRYVAGVPEELR